MKIGIFRSVEKLYADNQDIEIVLVTHKKRNRFLRRDAKEVYTKFKIKSIIDGHFIEETKLVAKNCVPNSYDKMVILIKKL